MNCPPLMILAALCLAAQAVAYADPTAVESIDPLIPHAFDAGWEGQTTCEVLFEDASMRIGRCVFPPGVGHEKHYHNPHFGYVLEGGTLSIRDGLGEQEVATTAGGSWSTLERTVHEARNIGETTTSYLIVEPKTP